MGQSIRDQPNTLRDAVAKIFNKIFGKNALISYKYSEFDYF